MADDLAPILQRLEDRLDGRIACIEEKLDGVRTKDLPNLRVEIARDISALKVKAGVWGLGAGLLGSIGTILYAMLRG